ncbi:hypothetical protein VTP21DRAFT_8906 [Calcarisporiella thermophila]
MGSARAAYPPFEIWIRSGIVQFSTT